MPDSPCAWRTILPLCALRKTVWRPCGIWTKPGCPAPCAPCAPHRPAGLPETGGGLRRPAPAPARGARKLRQALLEDLAQRIGQARRCNAALCDQLQTGPAG